MEPNESLNLLERILRAMIRSELRDAWVDTPGVDLPALEAKQREEMAKRRGAVVSRDLLDYAEFLQLQAIITKNYHRFTAALGKRKYIEVYFDRLNGFRNPSRHSRDLLPFERDLLNGIVGEFRNLLAIHRSSMDPDLKHYPVIDSIMDSYGNVPSYGPPYMRIMAGDLVTFTCRATDPEFRELRWDAFWKNHRNHSYVLGSGYLQGVGAECNLIWEVGDDAVREDQIISIYLRSTGKYHRFGSHDALVHFPYHVDPPRP